MTILNVTKVARGVQLGAPDYSYWTGSQTTTPPDTNGDGVAAAADAWLKGGIISCTASYYNNAGIGEYTLTPTADVPTLPLALVDGMRFRFVAPATADTGLINFKVINTSNGFVNGIGGPGHGGITFLTFHDIQKGEDVILSYSAAISRFVKIAPTPISMTAFKHGSVWFSGGGFMGTDPGNRQVNFGGCDGATILLKNSNTGGFQLCQMNGGIVKTVLAGGSIAPSCYVQGVANQVLNAETFYYVFAFNKGANSFDVDLDFYPVVPGVALATYGSGHLSGHLVLAGNDSRSYVGNLYTGNGDIGFSGTGAICQVLAHSWFNTTLIQTQTRVVTASGVTSSTFADCATSTTICVDAQTYLPAFYCRCSYSNNVAGALGELRLKVSGLGVNGDGSSATFTIFTDPARATCPTAGGWVQLQNQFAQALNTGWITVTPQVRVGAGTGTFEIDVLCNAWQ